MTDPKEVDHDRWPWRPLPRLQGPLASLFDEPLTDPVPVHPRPGPTPATVPDNPYRHIIFKDRHSSRSSYILPHPAVRPPITRSPIPSHPAVRPQPTRPLHGSPPLQPIRRLADGLTSPHHVVGYIQRSALLDRGESGLSAEPHTVTNNPPNNLTHIPLTDRHWPSSPYVAAHNHNSSLFVWLKHDIERGGYHHGSGPEEAAGEQATRRRFWEGVDWEYGVKRASKWFVIVVVPVCLVVWGLVWKYGPKGT